MKTTATHTPGPWTATECGGSFQRPFIIQGGGKLVAGLEGDQLKPSAASISEARANANLIAAAPDLLAAMVDCLEWLDSTPGGLGESASESVRAGWDAVARAAGKTVTACPPTIATPARCRPGRSHPRPRRREMAETEKPATIKEAAAALVDAIMRDAGGFSLETLHAMNSLSEVAGLPDHRGVTAATDWAISGEGEENVRFFGAGAHVDASSN